MLTRNQIIELVDAARGQGIADVIIPALTGLADLDCATSIVDWMIEVDNHIYWARNVGDHAYKCGVALLAYAVGSDLAWQLADDASNALALSALLDLVADACYA
jgi:hypothetical protein